MLIAFIAPAVLESDQNGSLSAHRRRSASPDTACAQPASVGAVSGSSGSRRSSILPPSKPLAAMVAGSYAVKRSSSDQVAPSSPPRFHRAEHDLLVERP